MDLSVNQSRHSLTRGRYFGVHEPFLKELGVREEPSALDYVQFLRDLAHESRDTALNPNELRAVVRIVQAVAVRRGEESQARELNSGNLTSAGPGPSVGVGTTDNVFVPDRDSYLREARHCVANDDEWLSIRLLGEGHAGFAGNSGGTSLYVLHPSVGLTVAAQLNIPRIR